MIAPHALRLLFEQVDGRRDLLASGLGVSDASDSADAIVGVVQEIRDGLGLPSQLRTVEGSEEEMIGAVASVIHGNDLLRSAPLGFDPTVGEVESAIRLAW